MGDWNEDRVNVLTRYVADGLSASQIGALMNISRNAVIGKVHRTPGLTLKVKPAGRPKRKRKPVIRVAQQAPDGRAPEPPQPGPEGGVHIMDLEQHHCRAVIGQGDDGLARYCGARKEGFIRTHTGIPVPSSYCAEHGNLYYSRSR